MWLLSRRYGAEIPSAAGLPANEVNPWYTSSKQLGRLEMYGRLHLMIARKRFLVEMALGHITDCKVIPSSFSVKDRDDPVSLLVNGSQFLFLFLINSRKTVSAVSFSISTCTKFPCDAGHCKVFQFCLSSSCELPLVCWI